MMCFVVRVKSSVAVALMLIFSTMLLHSAEVLANEVHEAVLKDDLEKLSELVQQGKAVNNQNKEGLTPLHYAAAIGKLPMIETLLTHGADVNARDARDVTPLFFATQEGHTDVVKLLISRGADVNVQHMHGATPLHVAALDGRIDIAHVLLEARADPLTVNDSHETPLMVAAASDHKKLALVLSDAIAEMDRHVATKEEIIPYTRLRSDYNGGDISNGRVWGRDHKSIADTIYPTDQRNKNTNQAHDEIKSLSGSWTMGNVLFMGYATFEPEGVKVSEGTAIFYRVKRSGTRQAQAKTPTQTSSGSKQIATAAAAKPVVTNSTAYRIQIYAGQTASNIDKIKSKAEQQFADVGLHVYEHKEGGLRKLILGNIGSRAEADALLTKVRQTGYPTAWIVSPP